MFKPHHLTRLGLAIVFVTLSVGPFFQGFFFSQQSLGAMTSIGLAALVWAVGRRMERREFGPITKGTNMFLLASTTWTALVTIWSVYTRGNVELSLKAIAAFLVFYMLHSESTPKNRRWLVWSLSLTGLAVAVLGLLEYAGFFMDHPSLGNLFGIEVQRTRLYTVFQYPNTAALFFLITLLLQNSILCQSQSLTEKLLMAGMSSVIATSFVFTLSRGAFLVTPVAFLLLWFGLSSRMVFSSILHFAVAVVLPAALTLNPIGRAAPLGDLTTVLLWAIGAATLSCLGTAVLHPMQKLSFRLRFAITLLAISALVVAGLVYGGKITARLPQVFGRVTQLNAEVITRSARAEYFKDAVTLAARRPWGYGGGGWSRFYPQVQQVNYTARDPHSHYSLSLVETGVPGLLLFVVSVGAATYSAFRETRKDPICWAMIVGALTLAGHAAFDIDLSYFVMWLVLWALLGVAQPSDKQSTRKTEPRLTLAVVVSLATVTLVFGGSLFEATRRYAIAEAAVLLGDQQTALRAGNVAIALDPLNSQFRTMIPSAQNIDRALQLDPYNEAVWSFVAEILTERGDLNGSVIAATRALELRPMSVRHYERVASLRSELMTRALDNRDLNEAKVHAMEIVELGQTLESRAALSIQRQQEAFSAYTPLAWTPALHLATGKAEFVLGNQGSAEEHLKAVLHDDALSQDASLWLHALYSGLGDNNSLVKLEPAPPNTLLRSNLYAVLLELSSGAKE